MLHTLKLQSGEATTELTYDGLGLRIEGNVKVVQRGKSRCRLSLLGAEHSL